MPESIPTQPSRLGPSTDSLSAVYLNLVHDGALWDQSSDQALKRIIKATSHALNVSRVSIWAYSDDRCSLTLHHLYQRERDSFSSGQELLQSNLPNYFDLLASGRLIDVADLINDARTLELRDSYSKPLGLGALLDATLRQGGKVWGVLSIENSERPRLWSEAEKSFALSIADLISQAISFAAVRASELQLRFICDHLPVGIIRTDFDGRCLYVNPYWSELTGISAEQSSGKGWLDAISPPHRALIETGLTDITHGGEQFQVEFELQHSAHPRWFSSSWIVEHNADGFPIGVLGGCFDISRERLSAQRLRDMTTLQQAILEGANHSIITTDLDGVITSFNRAAETLLGYSAQETVGRNTPAVFHDADEIVQRARQLSEELQEPIDPGFTVFVAKAQRGVPEEREWTYVHKSGKRIPVSLSISVLHDDDGAVTGYLGIAADLSERRQAEHELAEATRLRNWRNQVGFELSNLLSVTAVGEKALELLAEMTNAHRLSFFFAAKDTIRIVAERGGDSGVPRLLPAELTPTPALCALRQPAYVDDVATSALLTPQQGQNMRRRATLSITVLPLINEGLPQGFMMLEYPAQRPRPALAVNELEGFAVTVAIALARAHSVEELAYRAEHDALTQLPNRSVLQRELSAAIVLGEPLLLMLIDLDRFKEVNDTLGHHIGDKLLCELSERLRIELDRYNALLCRLGGDEFAVVLQRGDEQQGLDIARDLIRSLQSSFAVDGITLQIGASIGIACFPQHGGDYHALLRAADVAMYTAKHNALGAALYAPKLDANTRERLHLMAELGDGIRNGELVLHYQPKILLQNSLAVSGVEALVRWQHPRAGLLPPSAFMPIAEISDSIHPLTLAVLDEALAQQRRWLGQGLQTTVAVNLSTRNLLHSAFFDEVQALLRKHAVDPQMLELEITETSLMHDPAGAAAMLGKMAAIGIKIAIDDFGTGYSSLAYLRKLPLHALKIDRAFVTELHQNAQDQVIVRSIIALAHNLNLQVVAEGVEDEIALALLREMGCDCVQGFLFARPLPATALDEWRQNFAVNTGALWPIDSTG